MSSCTYLEWPGSRFTSSVKILQVELRVKGMQFIVEPYTSPLMKIGNHMENNRHTILLVDDDTNILASLKRLFRRENYNILTALSGMEGLEILKANTVALIISDNKMLKMNGVEFLSQAKEITPASIRFMLTGYSDIEAISAAINSGEVYRYVTKPWNDDGLKFAVKEALDRYELINENRNLLELTKSQNRELVELNKDLELRVEERTFKLQETSELLRISTLAAKESTLETIHRLTLIAEFKDQETALHVKRVSNYASFVAKKLGLSEEEVELISYASPLHDIGKVGIPSEILLKTGGLNSEEFTLMSTHATVGAKILQSSKSEFLQMGSKIALTHHERWDGSGYPSGLKETEIPIEGRIMNLIDQYDALRSSRPYKFGLEHDAAYTVITEGDGRTEPEHFDPKMLELFKDTHKEFARLYDRAV